MEVAASAAVNEKRMPKHILIGCTGSVASIKIPLLVDALRQSGLHAEIKIVSTQNALHFFKKENMEVPVLTDADEWDGWSSVKDPVLHIELRRWADVMLIAPLDANTLAKIANGMCDNLLTCVVRAWDPARPLLFAPAMNTYMWEHPVTAPQVAALVSRGYTEVPCIRKKLACGDVGYGAMADVTTLVEKLTQVLEGVSSQSKYTEPPTHPQNHEQHLGSPTDLQAVSSHREESYQNAQTEFVVEATEGSSSASAYEDTHYAVKQEYFG